MVEREAAVLGAAKLFQCPECIERFEKPEELGGHLERHREVTPPSDPSPRGKILSFPCPKNCGRNFKRLTDKEARAHTKLCDGSEPIVVVIDEPKKEEPVANLKCKWCDKPYKHQARLETHESECEKIGRSGETSKPKKPRAAKPSSNGNGSIFELALAPLRTRREEILAGIPELAEIDGAIAAIENAKAQGGGEPRKQSLRRADNDGSVEEDPELP